MFIRDPRKLQCDISAYITKVNKHGAWNTFACMEVRAEALKLTGSVSKFI